MVVAAGPFAGVTEGGLKVEVAPLGRPEQAKVTGCLNPFLGVTVRVSAAAAPALTVSAALGKESE